MSFRGAERSEATRNINDKKYEIRAEKIRLHRQRYYQHAVKKRARQRRQASEEFSRDYYSDRGGANRFAGH